MVIKGINVLPAYFTSDAVHDEEVYGGSLVAAKHMHISAFAASVTHADFACSQSHTLL